MLIYRPLQTTNPRNISIHKILRNYVAKSLYNVVEFISCIPEERFLKENSAQAFPRLKFQRPSTRRSFLYKRKNHEKPLLVCLAVLGVLALSGADGNITVGTGDGYVTFVGLDGGTIWGCTVIDPCVDVLPSLVVQSVMSLGDTIWLGTAQGAARHTPSDSETPLVLFADGLEGDALSVTALASFENRIWAGTMDGAYYFDADLELWIATDGLTDNVSDFLVANGMLIAANSNLPELPSDDEGVFVWEDLGYPTEGG